MSRFLRAYQSLLQRRPYTVQAIQTSLLMSTGDFLSQVFIEKKSFDEYNLVRTAKFAGFGLLLAGPSLHLWYKTLETYIKSTGFKGLILKVSADQLLFSPTFITVFISTMGALNGESTSEISNRLDRDFSRILFTNWKVWPAVQLVNFSIVPFQYRVLVAQTVAIFWNTYLAYVTNQSTENTSN